MNELRMKVNNICTPPRINLRIQIERGIEFIERNQLHSGEILSFSGENKNIKNPKYVKNLAVTFLVLWALDNLKSYPKVNRIIHNGIKFLLNERENDMTWRFFGKDSNIIPDLDDTASILHILKANDIPLYYEEYATRLLKIRNKKGFFYTWFPGKGDANNIDWIVNINVLCFFHKLGMKVHEVERLLINIAKRGEFKKGSLYYHSPYAFGYFFSKLYVESRLVQLEPIKDYITNFIFENHENLNCIDLAMSISTLLNLSNVSTEVINLIEKLKKMQTDDGGYPIGTIFKHRSKEIYYGSRVLTTAFVIESMINFLN